MNCLILGYGKMGKTIERLLINNNDKIIATIDNAIELKEKHSLIKKADVAFEFSTPSTAYNNILTCFDNDIPVVCGTTGWSDNQEIETLKDKCNSLGKTLLYSPNFSIGINIMLELNARLSDLLNKFDNYKISITETHHIHKKDAPSGTALLIKNVIIAHLNDKDTDIPIKSIREGEIVGIHTTTCTSDVDTIELKHTATSRDAFASGAITAAKWLIGKKGYFCMQDVMNF